MIGGFRFGSVEIDGETYDHDVIYHQGRVAKWWRRDGHNVSLADVESLLRQRPEIVVFGTGAMGAMAVGDDARAALEQAGIEVYAEQSGHAVERFNSLWIEGRNVALALHLTC